MDSHASLPVLRSRHHSTDPKDVFKSRPTPIETDWYGEIPVAKTRFWLRSSEGVVVFAAECHQRPWADATVGRGEFREFLWERDVAEWFVRAPDSTRYLEFNLSPYGAWWCCRFWDVLIRDEEGFEPPEVKTYSEVTDTRWRASIAIPIPFLEEELGCALNDALANVTFITNGEGRQHLSWASLSSEKPNYHEIEGFLPLD